MRELKINGGIEQWSARWAHNSKVNGSNPFPATLVPTLPVRSAPLGNPRSLKYSVSDDRFLKYYGRGSETLYLHHEHSPVRPE